MKLDELINKVDDIAVNSGALTTLDFFELAQMFFKQDKVKEKILDLNRDRLYIESTNNNGLVVRHIVNGYQAIPKRKEITVAYFVKKNLRAA